MATAEPSEALGAASARASWYQYRDGVNEIGTGVALLGTAGMCYMLYDSLRPGEDRWAGLIWGFAGIAVSFLDAPLKKFLRRRLTYPRLGYLSDKPGEPLRGKRVFWVIMAIALA